VPPSSHDLDSVADERDRLRAEISEIRGQAIEQWLATVRTESVELSRAREMERSRSWRITRPLRAVQTIRLRAAKIGYGRALRLAVPFLVNDFRARRRG
jgi:hypothetical protein